jgi:prepilin-type N-terminal cleavage/methylation domain-containing protein
MGASKEFVMRKRTGFTLVELLVVIAIIALLMSILMPALARVRMQAKAVMCQSNLKQWGNIFCMYAEDNRGYFPGYDAGTKVAEHWWPVALLPYYRNLDLCVCPAANRFWTDGAPHNSPFTGWGVYNRENAEWFADAMVKGYDGLYGSYGTNEWIGNLADEEREGVSLYWRRAGVKGAGNIPMLLDSNFMGGFPDYLDDPPEYNGYFWIVDNQMTRYCLDRHNGAINAVFLDYTVRKVGLKELWLLKWHRQFRTDGPWTKRGGVQTNDWPEWMRGFKDYK